MPKSRQYLFIIIFIILMGGSISLFGWLRLREKPQPGAPSGDGSATATATLEPQPTPQAVQYTISGLAIPHQVSLYNGVIQEIGSNYLIIGASAHNNYLPQDTLFKVRFDQDTEFLRYIIPNSLDEQALMRPLQEKINGVAELQVSQTVVVHSKENIEGTTAAVFTADKIVVLGL